MIAGQHITATTTLHVTTIDLPTPGGGTANTAFLKGGADGPNATAVSAACTFWLETLQGQSAPTQLQYTQTVLLNFNDISLAARDRRDPAQVLSAATCPGRRA